ncbi:MAG: hypothetical protein HY329_00850, partial [Chloroflexi bacterium]|nr:hypothetical protein [Chloroflexota bacterium]
MAEDVSHPLLAQALRQGRPVVAERLSAAELERWENNVRSLAGGHRGWEVGAAYCAASEQVVELTDAAGLTDWTELGRRLTVQSATVGLAYFRASASVLAHFGVDRLGAWADLALRLRAGSRHRDAVAARLLEDSPALLTHLDLTGLAELADLLREVARRADEHAVSLLSLVSGGLGRVAEPLRRPLLRLIARQAATNWPAARSTWSVAPDLLRDLNHEQALELLPAAAEVADQSASLGGSLLTEGAHALGRVEPARRPELLALLRSTAALSAERAVDLARSAPALLGQYSAVELAAWAESGWQLLRENPDAAAAHFRRQSRRAEMQLTAANPGLGFAEVAPVLSTYAQALTGYAAKLQTNAELTERGLGLLGSELPTTDGQAIFLPERVDAYASKAENFAYYKVLATHQAARLEFGTFNVGRTTDDGRRTGGEPESGIAGRRDGGTVGQGDGVRTDRRRSSGDERSSRPVAVTTSP